MLGKSAWSDWKKFMQSLAKNQSFQWIIPVQQPKFIMMFTGILHNTYAMRFVWVVKI